MLGAREKNKKKKRHAAEGQNEIRLNPRAGTVATDTLPEDQ